MTGKSGNELGVELGRLWNAGKHDLPKVAEDYSAASSNIPLSVSSQCARGNGLGSNPGASIDAYASTIEKMLSDTKSAVSNAGEALVWIANEYAKTDESCRSSFDRTKTDVDQAGGN